MLSISTTLSDVISHAGLLLLVSYGTLGRRSRNPCVPRNPGWKSLIYSVLLIFARGHDLFRSANAVSAGNRKIFRPLCHLAPLLWMTPFEFMEKLYW